MQWIKWTLMAAVGCIPALPGLVLADEPAKPATNEQHDVQSKPAENQDPSLQIVIDGVIPVGRDGTHKLAPPPDAPVDFVRLWDVQDGHPPLQFMSMHMKREKGAYLGVSTAPAPAVLRKQLGLSAGMGLVVDIVVPESPAARAGLQPLDVLQKLDDQLIVNVEQLVVLVRSHKVGDEVKLGIIHEGKPATLTVKLGEHELEPIEVGEIKYQIENLLPNHGWQLVPGSGAPGQTGATGNPPGNTRVLISHGSSSVTWFDGDRSFTVTTTDQGQKTFVVKAKDGKMIFEGPINTKEEREKVPADLREKLATLQQTIPGDLAKSLSIHSAAVKPTTLPADRRAK